MANPEGTGCPGAETQEMNVRPTKKTGGETNSVIPFCSQLASGC